MRADCAARGTLIPLHTPHLLSRHGRWCGEGVALPMFILDEPTTIDLEGNAMIVDQITNVDSDLYAGLLQKQGGSFKLAERLATALKFLQEGNVTQLPPSHIELEGDKVFAMIQ